MAFNAVTDNSTGSVIMYGYSDFTGQFDPATQSQVALNEGAVPPEGVPLYYVKVVDGNFVEMTASEKEAVDNSNTPPATTDTGWTLEVDTMKVGTENYDAYSTALDGVGNLTTGTLAVNTLYAFPKYIPQDVRIDRLGINVQTTITGLARLGVYKNKNGYPKRLVYDAGEIDLSASGATRLTGNQRLRTGMNWFVIVANAAGGIRCHHPDRTISPPLGYAQQLGNSPRYGFTVPFTYAALPSQFPDFSGASFITAAPVPAIFMRFDKFLV